MHLNYFNEIIVIYIFFKNIRKMDLRRKDAPHKFKPVSNVNKKYMYKEILIIFKNIVLKMLSIKKYLFIS